MELDNDSSNENENLLSTEDNNTFNNKINNEEVIDLTNIELEDDNNNTDEFCINEIIQCGICKTIPDENEAVEIENCYHRFCCKCLHDYIIAIGLENSYFKCPREKCNTQFIIDYWVISRRVLTEDEYELAESFRLSRDIENEDIVTCPNCKENYSVCITEIHDNITGEEDDEGNIMSIEHIQHRDIFRVRCGKCSYI